MDSAAEQDVFSASKIAEQQGFIDKFQELLAAAHAPGITLTNIYKEMPISCPATICEIKGHRVELQTSELQLAAISQCSEAYILFSPVAGPILGRLDSIDIRKSTVRLANFSYSELHANRRSTVRVRFKKPINIVAQAGSNKISGMIHDISLGGCCINTLVKQGLDQGSEIMVALKLLEQATGQGLCMQIPSNVVRVDGKTPPFKCALRFTHPPQTEQLLSIYIYQRQLEILKELRESL